MRLTPTLLVAFAITAFAALSPTQSRAVGAPPCPCGASALRADPGLIQASRSLKGRVVEAVDGYTLEVRLHSGRTIVVRLIGIDTRETKRRGTPAECGARPASRALHRLADGRRVTLVTDPSQDRRAGDGRLLVYAIDRSGLNMNLAMVRRGWAKVLVDHHNPFERLRGFRRAQRSARKAGRGLWGLCGRPFDAASGLGAGSGASQAAVPQLPTGDEPPPEPEPFPGCEPGAANATTSGQVVSAVQADDDVCVTAQVGDLALEGMGTRSVVISTEAGGSMGAIEIKETTGVTIRAARFRSIDLREADDTRLLGDVIGGTRANRVEDQLILMPDESNDVEIRGNDIGWTLSDNSGNTGYGCRCYGTLNDLRFVGNKVHDIAADGFQGVGGENVLIDRNEIGPVGANPGSSEHSDNIQIVDNGPNLRITNNWIHHQGYFEGEVTANSGSTYVHGGSSNSLVYENNLIEIAQGRTEICGLGTGGNSRSNIAIRNNTWIEGGLAFDNFPGFEWDCDSGSGDTITRNIAIDPDEGLAQDGFSSAFVEPNLWGTPGLVTFDAAGDCTSPNCNPLSGPIGYRKPPGVRW